MQTQEQLAATQKVNVDVFFSLSSRMVEGVEKLARLNLQATRSALDETLELARRALSVKEPQEWLALQDSLVAPTAEKVQSYGVQLFDIVAATQAECGRCTQALWDTYGRQAKSLVESVAKNTPAGSEAAVAALDSAISAAGRLVETLQQSGRQAVEVARSNLDIAAAAASKSAKRAIGPATQAAKQ